MQEDSQQKRCPRCGQGVLIDVTFREGSAGQAAEPIQMSDTHQIESYSCGHEMSGPPLDQTAAGSEGLDVEHRGADETVDPA